MLNEWCRNFNLANECGEIIISILTNNTVTTRISTCLPKYSFNAMRYVCTHDGGLFQLADVTDSYEYLILSAMIAYSECSKCRRGWMPASALFPSKWFNAKLKPPYSE